MAKLHRAEEGGELYLHMERPSKDPGHGFFEDLLSEYLTKKFTALQGSIPGLHVAMWVKSGVEGNLARVESIGNIGPVEDVMDHASIIRAGRAAHFTLDITFLTRR